jgi:cyanate permease
VLDIASVIGAASGPAVAGYIFDATANYTLAWFICVGAAGILTILIITYFKLPVPDKIVLGLESKK